jgi:hypothetical protein
MTLPIAKKSIIDKMADSKTEIANKISVEDKKEIKRLMQMFNKHRDARGRWQVPKNTGLELFAYFKKYVDPKASPNLFGCGGCAQKMVTFMADINKIWQNQTK